MTFIIAEVGVNHDGNMRAAAALIDAAKQAGADAVKFQHFNSQRLWGDDRIAQYELSDAEILNLKWRCDQVGIEFMCTPFGVAEAEFLAPLVKRMKVASGCIGRRDLLQAVRDTGLPVILSTGMATIEDVAQAMRDLGYDNPGVCKQPYTLLHCTSAYPCPLAEVNLAAMEVLRWGYGERCAIGYSDHTEGLSVALAAVARGATVIEKHLTLDRNAAGPDHKASIEPFTFRIMVDGIRAIEEAIGEPAKRVQPSEAQLRKVWRD